MEIQIERHTLERAAERGASEEEIKEVILEGHETDAKYNRLAKFKVYEYNNKRNKKYYEQKKVEVIYFIKENKIVTVTVYVFYGKWEAK